MNILLIALGSHGDVHPFVGIGLALRERGHDVRVVANGYFEPLIRDAGLRFIECGTADEYRQMATDPKLWQSVRGVRFIFSAIARYIPVIYRAVVENDVPGQTVVGASTLALGARVAQDRHGIPTASIHLQPSIFRSVIEPPHVHGPYMPGWMPHWMKRMQFRVIDRMVDQWIGPELNAFRKGLGLPPVRRVLGQYIHSPQRVIGLFPEWYARPQPDWPTQTVLTGFPLYDERGLSQMPAELVRFLDAGEPPVAFTPGSAMWSGHRFLEESAQACRILGRRGVLLTRHREHLPKTLPPGVIHADYAPFSELLPRCAALVHHGGIGTSAQALAAGVPQLPVPHAHDQPDNAWRLERLGVARQIPASRYRAERAARLLAELVGSPEVHRNYLIVKEKFRGQEAVQRTCEVIEKISSDASDPMAAASFPTPVTPGERREGLARVSQSTEPLPGGGE